MSTSLVTTDPTALAGVGINSALFRLKPIQLELVQKMSRGDGAIPGKFRIPATNQHLDEMHIVLLAEPRQKRTYWPKGSDFGAEPLCRSNDAITPAENAKAPQALACANCPHNDWDKWKRGGKRQEDIPPCKNAYEILFVDRVSHLPYRLQLRGTSIAPFMEAMQVLAMHMQMLKAQGKNPNIFDFSMKIRPSGRKNNTYYVVQFADIALIKEEDRATFGQAYIDFVARKVEIDQEEEQAKAESEINTAVTGTPASSGPVEGEYLPV